MHRGAGDAGSLRSVDCRGLTIGRGNGRDRPDYAVSWGSLAFDMAQFALGGAGRLMQFFQRVLVTAPAFGVIGLGGLRWRDREPLDLRLLFLVALGTAFDRLAWLVCMVTTLALDSSHRSVQAVVESNVPLLALERYDELVLWDNLCRTCEHRQKQQAA